MFYKQNKLCSKLFVLTWNLTLVCCRIGFSLLGLLCKTLYRMKTACIQSVEHNWKIIAFFWETILQFLCQCFILHDKMNLNCLEYSHSWINDILGLCLKKKFFFKPTLYDSLVVVFSVTLLRQSVYCKVI